MKKGKHYTQEELYDFYYICKEYLESGLTASQFCKHKNLPFVRFLSAWHILSFLSTNPEEHNAFIEHYQESVNFGETFYDFCDQKNINKTKFKKMLQQVSYYKKIIREHKLRNEPFNSFIFDCYNENILNYNVKDTMRSMNFVEANKPTKPTNPIYDQQHSELPQLTNDIEIIIKKGVKVTIENSISTENIIKIIEFLKEL